MHVTVFIKEILSISSTTAPSSEFDDFFDTIIATASEILMLREYILWKFSDAIFANDLDENYEHSTILTTLKVMALYFEWVLHSWMILFR